MGIGVIVYFTPVIEWLFMSNDEFIPASKRRSFMQAVAAATTVGLAGCPSGGPSDSESPSGEGDATVTPTQQQAGGQIGGIGNISPDVARKVQDLIPNEVTVEIGSPQDAQSFNPPVIQTVPGGTVTWDVVSGTHS
ncbi:MAG: hypothetical protein ACI8XM_002004, partial [Haloarculaceae archaeon]